MQAQQDTELSGSENTCVCTMPLCQEAQGQLQGTGGCCCQWVAQVCCWAAGVSSSSRLGCCWHVGAAAALKYGLKRVGVRGVLFMCYTKVLPSVAPGWSGCGWVGGLLGSKKLVLIV